MGELEAEELDVSTALTTSCANRCSGEEIDWDEDQVEQLPWNRRTRHQRAKRIILHLAEELRTDEMKPTMFALEHAGGSSKIPK